MLKVELSKLRLRTSSLQVTVNFDRFGSVIEESGFTLIDEVVWRGASSFFTWHFRAQFSGVVVRGTWLRLGRLSKLE